MHCACVVVVLKDDNLMVDFSVGRKLKCTAFCLRSEFLNHFPQYDTACGTTHDKNSSLTCVVTVSHGEKCVVLIGLLISKPCCRTGLCIPVNKY